MTETTIYNNTFELTYNATNVDNNNYNKMYVYLKMVTDGIPNDITSNPYTFIGFGKIRSYTFKLQVLSNDTMLLPDPNVPDIE